MLAAGVDALLARMRLADAPILARKLQRDFAADFGRSLEITRELWADRDLLPDLARRASALFADWL